MITWLLEHVAKHIKSASVLRRFIFARSFLPPDYTGLYPPLDVVIVKVLLDDLKMLEDRAFVTDLVLKEQIIVFPRISGDETYRRNPIAYNVVQLCFYVLIGQVISPYILRGPFLLIIIALIGTLLLELSPHP